MDRRRPRRKRSAGAANMARTATSARKANGGSKARPPAPSKASPTMASRTVAKMTPAPKAKTAATGNGAARGSAKPAARAAKTAERRTSEKVVHGGRAAVDAGLASRGKYVYCIIESGDALRFGPIGIGA